MKKNSTYNRSTKILIKKIIKISIIFFVLSLADPKLVAQNLELIGKSNSVKINGGVSTNQVYYVTSDTNSTRDPYSTVISGNINLQIYEWSLPLSFTWSNKNYSFQQPFNRYCLNPKYNWITAHIGYASMSFSPYSLNGQIFTGAGVDLSPKTWITVNALYGRFQKANKFDSLRPSNTAFQRNGYGLKTQIKLPETDKYTGEVGFVVFHARDYENSIPLTSELQPIYDSLSISPKENMTLGTSANFNFMQKIQLSAEYAQSALTRNLLDTGIYKGNYLFNHGLFHTNSSTEIYKAYKSNISYSFLEYNVGMGFEHIDPGYATLGAYYFVNDLENITINASGSFANKKITANGSIGKQRDNLNNKKSSSMRRWVTSLSMSYALSKRLNMAGSYSTFQSYTNIQSKIMQSYQQLNPYAVGDTLDYTQLSQSANINFTYNLSSNESSRKNLMMNFAWQTSSQMQKVKTTPGAKFYNINAAYAYGIVPIGFNITFSVNSIMNKAPGLNSFIIGPSLSASKTFLDKKLRASLSVSQNNSYMGKSLNSRITTVRFTGSMTIKKRNSLNLSLAFLNRAPVTSKTKGNSDFTATFGYAYAF